MSAWRRTRWSSPRWWCACAAPRMMGKFDFVLAPERPADAAARAGWPDFTGTYEVAPAVTLKVTLEGEQLRWRLSSPETPGDVLSGVFYPRAADRFFCPEYDLT